MRRAILVVAPCLPLPADFGGAIRTFHLVRELARDHDVIVVAPARADEQRFARALGEICDVTTVPVRTSVRQPARLSKRLAQLRSITSRPSFLEQSTWNVQLQQVIARLFMTRRIDVVQYEFTQMALHTLPRPCPTIIDAHNIEHALLARVAAGSDSTVTSMLKMMEARKIRRLEQSLWASVTACVATSSQDAAVIAPHSPAVVGVVPNGVDTAAFAPPAATPRRPHHIVFTGVLRHQPNVDGLLWYLRHVHPLVTAALPDATLSVVGADPPSAIARLASSSVSITGHVPDIRPYLHEASASIVPLFAGGGTRLKIVEAFAAGVPVTSTTIGAEGLDVEHGVELLVADEPAAFARHVVTLLSDPARAAQLAGCARQRAFASFDWNVVTRSLLAAHDRAIAGQR